MITAPPEYAPTLAYRTRCRTTLGVLTEVLAEAQRHVLITAPFFQHGYGLSGGPVQLALAAALKRGVNVDIASTGESLATVDFKALQASAVGRLGLFRPQRNTKDSRRLGSHAKFCVADAAVAYVGSANLTGPGLGEHIELGVLVRGTLAQQVADFWEYCLSIGLFLPYQSSQP